jgi:hypothetical protein
MDRTSVRPPSPPARPRDLVVDDRVNPVAKAVEPAHRAAGQLLKGGRSLQPFPDRGRKHPDEERPPGLDQRRQKSAELVQPPGVADAEHQPQDHLQRDRLHPRAQGEGLAERPVLDLGGGDARHLVAEGGHRPPVEGGRQELSLTEPLLALQAQHRVGADQRLEELAADVARVADVPVAGEDLPRQLRLRHVHELVEAHEADPEDLAVARSAALQETDRIAEDHRRLHHAWCSGAWGQRGVGGRRHLRWVEG